MSKDTIEIIVAIVVPVISALYTFFTHRMDMKEQQEIREEQKRLQDKQADIEAVAQYRQVKQLERDYKDDVIKLTVAVKNNDENAIHIAFLTLYSSFTDLFNEANAFCALLNTGAVSSGGVLKNTDIDLVIKLAEDQCSTYETLKTVAEKFGYKNELKRPDWNAFKEYDKFLMGHMIENKWEKLCDRRKNVGLKI